MYTTSNNYDSDVHTV